MLNLDLFYEMAARAKELSDMRMSVLRRVVEPDGGCKTRGEIIEWALGEEFFDDFMRMGEELEG